MILIIVTYLVAFLVATFITWKLGRRHQLDEDRIIDLVLFTTLFGLFWGKLIGSSWAFTISAAVFSIFYLKRLHWPVWKPFSFLLLGGNVAWVIITTLNILTGNIQPLSPQTILAPLTLILLLYIVGEKQNKVIDDFWKGLQYGFHTRVSPKTR